MRVIQSGRPGSVWTMELKCTGSGNGEKGCNARLQVDGGDLFHTCSSAMGERDDHVTFECPECKEWTDVSDKYLSVALRNNIIREEPRSPNRNRANNDPL